MVSPSSSVSTWRRPARERGSRAPSLQIVVAVFVTLLILFFWMQFLVAQEIESLGRGIVQETQELEKLERDNAALGWAIAEAASQETMKARAEGLGYAPQMPLYLPLPEPLAQPAGEERARDTSRLGAIAHTLYVPPETAPGP